MLGYKPLWLLFWKIYQLPRIHSSGTFCIIHKTDCRPREHKVVCFVDTWCLCFFRGTIYFNNIWFNKFLMLEKHSDLFVGLLEIVSRNELPVQLQVENKLSTAVVTIERHSHVIEVSPWRRDAVIDVTGCRNFSFWPTVVQPRLDDLVRRKLFGWNPVTTDSPAGFESGSLHFIVEKEDQKNREEF